MDESLPANKSEITSGILSGSEDTVEAIAKRYGMTHEAVRRFLADKDIQEEIRRVMRESAKTIFWMKAAVKLQWIIEHSKRPSQVIKASNTLSRILGEQEQGAKLVNQQNNQFNFFDQQIRRLAALTQQDLEGESDEASWPGAGSAPSETPF